MNDSPPPVDLADVIRWHLESERAFGLDALPLSGLRPPASKDVLAQQAPPTAVGGSPAPPSEAVSAADVAQALETLASRMVACTACRLSGTRTHAVPGQGNPKARLMFVGEAPGRDEDLQGLAFVGRSGQLLTRMIEALGLQREEVFIANVIKCRPPENRDPAADEVQACFHFLMDQIDLIRPEVICTLGGCATNNLLGRADPMHRMRGRVFPFRGAQVVPTYHPSYLLRRPEEKRKAWADLQVAARLLGLEIPRKS